MTEARDVGTGRAPGRQSPDEITIFDSTGLAIQNLAIGMEVVNRFRAGANAGSFSDVQGIDIG